MNYPDGGLSRRWRLLMTAAAGLAVFAAPLAATPVFSTTLVGAAVGFCPGGNNNSLFSTPVNHTLQCSSTTPFGADSVTETSLLQARADFTSLGVYIDYAITMSNGVSSSNLGLQSTARGSDQIVVTGGTGDGILRMTLTLSGQPVVQTGSLSLGIFWGFSWTGSVGVTSFSTGTLTADIPFTYGVPFEISRVLMVLVNGNASAGTSTRAFGDFFGSANLQPFEVLDLALNPVAGASVASDSFTYAVAGAPGSEVPEPATAAGLAAGAGTVLLLRLRRPGRS